MYKNLKAWKIIKIIVKKIFEENYTTPFSSLSKSLLLQLGAQEFTCELILGDNVDLPKLDTLNHLRDGLWHVTKEETVQTM